MKDIFSIWSSTICLIHCLAFPFLGTIYPIFLELDETVEISLLSFSLILGVLSFSDNILKHRYWTSLILFLIGFILLIVSVLTHKHILNYFSLIILILAHYLNYKKIQSLDGCHPHKCNHH